MVKIGRLSAHAKGVAVMGAAVTEVPFHEPVGTLPGVAVLSFEALVERARGHRVDPHAPMRPDFHHLITVTGGRLVTAVDFTDHLLGQGDWLWVRPRQILQFQADLTVATGTVVLFRSGFLDDATVTAADVHRPAGGCVPVRSDGASRAAELLLNEYGPAGDLPRQVHIEVIRRLLSVVLLHLAHAAGDEYAESTGAPYRRFRDAIEQDFTLTHRVEDYARDLGYSVRTLTRACRQVTGHGAKQVIDERVLLEAKRLLVHTDLTSSAIGARVGISDPTAFTKFFRTRTGQTPTAFRSRARGTLRRPLIDA